MILYKKANRQLFNSAESVTNLICCQIGLTFNKDGFVFLRSPLRTIILMQSNKNVNINRFNVINIAVGIISVILFIGLKCF